MTNKTLRVFKPALREIGSRSNPNPRGLFGAQNIFARQWWQMQVLFALYDQMFRRQSLACGSRIRAGDFRSAASKTL